MKLFDRAVNFVLGNEGHYSNDRHDPGGETKFGITKKSYPDINIKNLTMDHAKKIYLSLWNRGNYGKIDYDILAIRTFDLSVNIGQYRAGKFIQKAANESDPSYHIIEDGIIGPNSIEKINDCRSWVIYYHLCRVADEYYRSLNKPRYLRGWLNRLEKDIP